jgi:uncharacterized protein
MISVTTGFVHGLGDGAKVALSMVWMTWWPLVLGFTIAGLVQSLIPRGGLRQRLGATTPRAVVASSVLGVISSSCSYAASAASRALFARGASWTNSVIFMVASTNLVVELGIVLYLLLGWKFLLAQLVGGVMMVVLLAMTTRVLFRAARAARLEARVLTDAPPLAHVEGTWRERLRDRENLSAAARYTIGDLTMLRRELVAGFVIAGFVSADVPASWWRHLFWNGHGAWTVLEDAIVAPLLAVVTFVCSVGNIPLAAALWGHGVAFGGVIAFIFADLITLPLLMIYRRFYGAAAAWRLFLLLWFVISVSGLFVNGVFHVAHLVPSGHGLRVLSGLFPLGSTLVLNVLATLLLAATWWTSRRAVPSARVATDPICAMSVEMATASATSERDGATYYFCSPRCKERFDHGETAEPRHDRGPHEHHATEQRDPVCGMTVDPSGALVARGEDGLTYYFCSAGCRATFLEGPRLPASLPIEIGQPSPDE